MSTDTTPELTPEQLAEIERQFDPETTFRPTGKIIGFVIAAVLVSMSVLEVNGFCALSAPKTATNSSR